MRFQERGGLSQARSTLSGVTPSSEITTLRSKSSHQSLKVIKEFSRDQVPEPAPPLLAETASLK